MAITAIKQNQLFAVCLFLGVCLLFVAVVVVLAVVGVAVVAVCCCWRCCRCCSSWVFTSCFLFSYTSVILYCGMRLFVLLLVLVGVVAAVVVVVAAVDVVVDLCLHLLHAAFTLVQVTFCIVGSWSCMAVPNLRQQQQQHQQRHQPQQQQGWVAKK